jgi:hypothetical protein
MSSLFCPASAIPESQKTGDETTRSEFLIQITRSLTHTNQALFSSQATYAVERAMARCRIGIVLMTFLPSQQPNKEGGKMVPKHLSPSRARRDTHLASLLESMAKKRCEIDEGLLQALTQ